jgi:farnesyl-diphosphate farnesyltransferase
MGEPGSELLTDLLRQVSRSFYLTMRVLPSAIRRQIGLAYLLARTTDTIADTQLLPLDKRLEALRWLRERISGDTGAPFDLDELIGHQGSTAERSLLERIEEALDLLSRLPSDDQQHVREVLSIITSGQELDLARFANASVDRVVSLNTDQELDDYTYRVAGCVGEFWTKICRAHIFADAAWDDAFLLDAAVRFGKGLQLVNILRDLPRDLRQGRCYLPEDRLWAIGLTPFDLLEPSNEPRLRPLYDSYLAVAEDHLAAGWHYTLALPRPSARVRLACAWPILIGIQTLDRLATNNVLAPELRVKISRADVRRIVTRSVLCYPWPMAWARLFKRVISTAEAA